MSGANADEKQHDVSSRKRKPSPEFRKGRRVWWRGGNLISLSKSEVVQACLSVCSCVYVCVLIVIAHDLLLSIVLFPRITHIFPSHLSNSLSRSWCTSSPQQNASDKWECRLVIIALKTVSRSLVPGYWFPGDAVALRGRAPAAHGTRSCDFPAGRAHFDGSSIRDLWLGRIQVATVSL